MKSNSVYTVEPLKLDRYSLNFYEALFHNANGYIGIRYDLEEGVPQEYNLIPSQYINGFYDTLEVKHPEYLHGFTQEKEIIVNIADNQGIKLYLGDEVFSMFKGTVLESRLSVDMGRGVTIREVKWQSEKGKIIRLKITRMASFYQLPLFTIDYEVEPVNFSGPVSFESTHNRQVCNYHNPDDPRTASEFLQLTTPLSCEVKEDGTSVEYRTKRSNLSVASCVSHSLFGKHEEEISAKDYQGSSLLKTEAKEGETIRLVKYAVYCDSLRYKNCRGQAEEEIKKAKSVTMDFLYERQENYLKEYWENCSVDIEGDDELDLAVKYNLYQLIQAVGKDRHSNISPKGLSGDGYEGHYFWDAEMYIQPFFTITNPAISKSLIAYRHTTLQMAKENAALVGHKKGALYPWRTITGRECSGYFPAGRAQYHINGAVAYSIINYYLATKDLEFVLEKGAEVLFETARLWLDTGNFHEGKFMLNTVTGPDEYTCLVNNNYYTNALAKYHLEWAVKLYKKLGVYDDFIKIKEKIALSEDEIEEFSRAAACMYLPYDEKLGINPQDDSFLQKKKWDIAKIPQEKFPLLLHYHPLHIYRHQICKQADTVLAHFILEDMQSEETMRNSFLYYEKITTHDSSLSKAIFSIMAARLNMEKKASAYFGESAKLDLLDLQGNTIDGVHIANMGGSFLTIVYGFAGFRLKEEGISFAPMLPKGWQGYRFEVCYEDSRIQVQVTEQECVFELEKGTPKRIRVYGRDYLLEDVLVIERNSSR